MQQRRLAKGPQILPYQRHPLDLNSPQWLRQAVLWLPIGIGIGIGIEVTNALDAIKEVTLPFSALQLSVTIVKDLVTKSLNVELVKKLVAIVMLVVNRVMEVLAAVLMEANHMPILEVVAELREKGTNLQLTVVKVKKKLNKVFVISCIIDL